MEGHIWEAYRLGLHRSMGDHIDWATLEAYKVSEASWQRELLEEFDELYTHYIAHLPLPTSTPIDPYNHWRLFRAPDNVNDLWLSEVSLVSDLIVHTLDKVNMVLSGGILSPRSHRFLQYSSTAEKHQLELLRQLSEVANEILSFESGIGESLEVMRNQGFQQAFMEEIGASLGTNVACFYTMLATKNMTFYNTVMQTVPEAELVKFGQDFVEEAFRVTNSQDVEFNLKKVFAELKKALKIVDFDLITSKVILSLLRVRSLVIGVDIHKMFESLDNVHRHIGEGVWRLTTGQWPEMLQLIHNFVGKTVKSEIFWQKVDEVFQEIVADAKMKYIEKEKTITHKLKPFLQDLLATMKQVQVKEGPLVAQLVSEITSKMFQVHRFLYTVASNLVHISNADLPCYTLTYGRPDFEELSYMVPEHPVVYPVYKFLRPIVLADWPEEQEVPAGLPAFIEQLQDLLLLLAASLYGECRVIG